MIIAQISDPHIPVPGKKTYAIAPMAENLVMTVNHINNLNPQPDVALITGDITANARMDEAEQAAKILGKLNMPFFIVPGNHDDRASLRSVFGVAFPVTEHEPMNFLVADYDIRLIGLDTSVVGAPGGRISAASALWLDKTLAEEQTKPTALFMHHPPVKLGVLETDVDGFEGSELLAAVISKYSNIECLLCGHIHLPTAVKWHGTIVTTAPSIGMELVLDLTLKQASSFILATPGYQLHYWTPQNNLVSHTRYVKQDATQYFFEDN